MEEMVSRAPVEHKRMSHFHTHLLQDNRYKFLWIEGFSELIAVGVVGELYKESWRLSHSLGGYMNAQYKALKRASKHMSLAVHL